ncbi:MAG: DUF1569 domain-containing protein [Gemmatimonadaceae bacterium]|jgi:hypothetical protein|nr:DUF1569 domain-containing protein [Gemmatimonadaceae bacterium]
MTNIFDRAACDDHIARLNRLRADTAPVWGKMTAAQMLAHCSKPYEMVCDPDYARTHKRPPAIMRFLLKTFLKPIVVGPKPYARNSRTAPEFIVADARDFTVERTRLIGYINQVQGWGRSHFDGKDNHSFGVMTADEWNNLFAKHLEHHLVQFGV